MSATTPTDVDTSIPEVWAKNVLRKTKNAGFWGRFIGSEGSGMPIIQKSELLNKEGDLIHIQVTDSLTGAGVEGDTATLEGNEENLSTSALSVSPVLYRHAVRVNRRAQKKSIVQLRSEAEFRLAEWGEHKMDDKRFANYQLAALPAPLASETYAPNYFVVGGNDGSPSVDDVIATEVLTVAELQKIKLALVNQLAKPVMVDGFPTFYLVTHPNATYQLKQDTRYEAWVREAAERGRSNPLFRGALAMIDGMVIFEHVYVPRAANAGAVKVAKSIAFGAEAFIEGLDENVSSNTDTFDYGLEWGVSYEFAFQPRRGLEQNSLQVYVAAPDVT